MTLAAVAEVEIRFADLNLRVDQLDHEVWDSAQLVLITHYWSGQPAEHERHANARLLWTPQALLARFEANQSEPLIVSPTPNTATKTIGLWERDVCEIFIAPNPAERNRYFEFEVAPNGEWVDLALTDRKGVRETQWDYESGMTAAARVKPTQVVIGMSIPWSNQIPLPSRQDEWRGNLCRCIGSGEDRGYLAWQPTLTDKANFHVPDKFGRLRFC